MQVATSAYGLLTGRERALSTYRHMSVETASRGELVLILFNESLRDMREAASAIKRNDIEGSSTRLLRAQDIIDELRGSLDADAGGELASRLDSMYGYIRARLIEANLKKALPPVEDAVRVMSELRDGWEEALHKHGA